MSTVPARRRAMYEVDVEFLQLRDPHGHRHFLRRGADVPAWVAPEELAKLVEAGAIYRFEVL